MLKQLLLIVWLLVAATSAGAGELRAESGDEPVSAVVPGTVPVPEDLAPEFFGARQLDGVQRYLSNNVEALSRRIDAFFGAERIYEEGSGTFVQVRGSTIYRKGGAFQFDNQVKGRLDLPNLKEKLALVVESDTADTIADARNTTGEPTVRESLDSKQVTASVQVVLKQEERWDVRLQPGIRLRLPPETFVRLRMRRPVALGATWLARFTLTPGWYDARGWEVKGLIDLERGTGQGALFRASTEAVWNYDQPDNLSLAEVFSFAHPLSSREKLAYSAGMTAETDPTWEDTAYFANIRYRRDIHRGWVFFELKPQILFAREADFRPDPSFAVTLEVLFGSRYLPTSGT